MRIAFVGAGDVAVRTARILIDHSHDVVIIETRKEKIDELSEDLDCSFLHGDGTIPAILKEVGPKDTDVLYCLTDTDQANLISSLVGRSLGFKRVITRIKDPGFEDICLELGLKNVIIPSRTISRYLSDMLAGEGVVELSTFLKHEARFFAFTVDKKNDPVSIDKMELPENTRVVLFYRDEQYYLPDENTRFQKDDEVVVITHSRHLNELNEKWKPRQSNSE